MASQALITDRSRELFLTGWFARPLSGIYQGTVVIVEREDSNPIYTVRSNSKVIEYQTEAGFWRTVAEGAEIERQSLTTALEMIRAHALTIEQTGYSEPDNNTAVWLAAKAGTIVDWCDNVLGVDKKEGD